MRIAIVAGPYLPVPPFKYGGSEQVIHYLVKGLIEAGHQPVLLATADSKVDCELIPIADRAIGFAKTDAKRQRQQLLIKKAAATTHCHLQKLLPNIDIIHSHGFDLQKFSHFPNLTTIHNSMSFSDLPYFLKRQNLFYATVSKNQQASCPDLNYVAAVYNGEDPSLFPVVTEPDNYVCFLGRLDRQKNPHLAIQLAIYMGIKIKVAGKIDHDGLDYFNKEVKPYLKHRLVDWLGEISETEKIKVISRAKCNLHPTSFREPFGLTVLEAAYCGTPTLAIRRGALPEIIEQGKTGMVVEDFAEGYYELPKCFAMDRQYIADQARRRFNYQKMTRQYIKAYQKVLLY